jgi:hypothetical protein
MPFADRLRSTYGDRVLIVPSEEEGTPNLASWAAALHCRALVYCRGTASMLTASEAAFPAPRLRVERLRPVEKTFAPTPRSRCGAPGRGGQCLSRGTSRCSMRSLTLD